MLLVCTKKQAIVSNRLQAISDMDKVNSSAAKVSIISDTAKCFKSFYLEVEFLFQVLEFPDLSHHLLHHNGVAVLVVGLLRLVQLADVRLYRSQHQYFLFCVHNRDC